MKLKKYLLAQTLVVCALIGLAFTASAQVSPGTFYSLANFPATVATGATATVTNIVPLSNKCTLGVQGVVTCSSGTTAVTVQGSFSVDGTNFSSTPFVFTFNANGATKVVWNTNFTTLQTAGYTAVNFTTLTNGNAGTLTNGGFIVKRVSEPTY